ncbi:MAG: chlorophyll synthesis pathway protein BchC [Pseudomonadota bacterium]
MDAVAVVLESPQKLALETVRLHAPGPGDVAVQVRASGVSTGTERLLWSGAMPSFPGLGYPLVPGYEATGEVVEAGPRSGLKAGDHVFVPGADCYEGARGVFGGASQGVVTSGDRVVVVDPALGEEATLLALAAPAAHALGHLGGGSPDLIVGHGALGRLLARLAVATGGRPPVVWEADPARRSGAIGYTIIDPQEDTRRDYRTVVEASGDATVVDTLISRLAHGGEIVLAGFYGARLSFSFPSAFMREARLKISAEWAREDLLTVRALVENGTLSLAGLITDRRPASDAPEAYRTAFSDPNCLKMILNWNA